ncbi:serine/threonine-protein kinase [Streptomyces coacervatus]|nr:serine/threonine-protein kinase [Streptomyces coacervatus]MDF2270971.1 serine/threonine-protein kinase [Streptomyces coacervatus]
MNEAMRDGDQWALPGYTQIKELGSGASGRVVLATHDTTGTHVAIKYLAEKLRDDPAFREVFRAEARLLGELRSPHVVELYEYVESPRGAAIVMELVDGVPLRKLLLEHGATTPEAALVVLKGSLLGLAAAHAAGVVHRDYKPDNVLVAADGSSKLVDFGIAVPSGAAANASGTPIYMAPEQWTGGEAGPATDVYAATATFFECLTGMKPYAGQTLAELAIQHIEAPIPDGLAPEPVRPLIRRGLAKTPEERPENAAAFVEELEAVATAAYGEEWEERGRRELAALAALFLLFFPLADGTASGTTALATTTLGQGARRLPGRRGKILAGLAAGVVLVVGGVAVTAVATGAGAGHRRTNAAGSGPAADGSTDGTGASGSADSPDGTPSASDVSSSPSGTGSPSASASGNDSASPGADGTSGGSTSGGAGGTGGGSSGAGGTTTTGGGSSSTGGGTGTTGGSTSGGGTATTSGGGTTTGGGTTSPPAPTLDVKSVQINAVGPMSAACTIVASVSVTTDGAADGTLYLSWFVSDSAGAVGTVVATDSVALPKGKTQISNRYTHSFAIPTRYDYLGVKVTTDPAADSGNGSFQSTAAPVDCDPPR